MAKLDVLICTLDKGIVRIQDNLLAPCENIHYIVSFQYSEERFLELIPKALTERRDVTFIKLKGKGLSANRNNALKRADSELVIFADDDTRFNERDFQNVIKVMDENLDVDIAFFQATTYTGRLLKDYPRMPLDMREYAQKTNISAIEMVCRRNRIQNKLFFDERFGLGTTFLTCGEEIIWLIDALNLGLKMRYFPIKMVETSTMLKQRMIYVDVGVQRAKGAIAYYKEGLWAWWTCMKFACNSTIKGYCHFFPMMRHLAQGIYYMQRTNRCLNKKSHF